LKIPVRISAPSQMRNFLGEKDAVFYSSAVGALESFLKTTTFEDKNKKLLDYLKETFNNIFRPFKE